MKVYYFIQSHKNPEQILRLVTAIKTSSPNCHIIISHDFSSSHLELNRLKSLTNIDLIKRYQPARRGDSSILEIFLEVLEYLFQNNIEFDWLVTLSGQDYPIQPISKFEEFLFSTQYDGFLNYYDFFAADRPMNKRQDAIKRYTSQYISLPSWCKPLLKKISRVEKFIPFLRVQAHCAMIGLKAWSTPFNSDFIAYRGYYWNTLSQECISYFRDFLKNNPKILKYYKKTLAPEESLMATVLVNSQKFNLAPNTLQYANFPLGLKGFATDILADELPSLIQQNYFFARKFDLEKNKEVFDILENNYLSLVQNS